MFWTVIFVGQRIQSLYELSLAIQWSAEFGRRLT
jgi:hypothetical protein|tara:strand:- start:145 stop:246 length:102 start_codon:yes stop_codon:yes gene_type:complete